MRSAPDAEIVIHVLQPDPPTFKAVWKGSGVSAETETVTRGRPARWDGMVGRGRRMDAGVGAVA